MRPSLERLGRFDPERSRERFRASFDHARTWHIVHRGERIGFVATRVLPLELSLDHLYLLPASQNLGIGSAVLRWVLDDADARSLPVRVGALRNSDSNRFYSRQGFVLLEQSEWDLHYVRPVSMRSAQ
jgi:GNAT superfamily N-acetyltransferase